MPPDRFVVEVPGKRKEARWSTWISCLARLDSGCRANAPCTWIGLLRILPNGVRVVDKPNTQACDEVNEHLIGLCQDLGGPIGVGATGNSGWITYTRGVAEALNANLEVAPQVGIDPSVCYEIYSDDTDAIGPGC